MSIDPNTDPAAPGAPLSSSHSTRWWLWASVVAFLLSLVMPAFCLINRCVPGYEALLSGWIHLLMQPQVGLCWLASPAVMFAWLCVYTSGRGPAMVISLAGLVLMVSFLFASGVVTGEDGTPHPVLFYHVGYWCWLVSAATAFLAARTLPRAVPSVRERQVDS